MRAKKLTAFSAALALAVTSLPTAVFAEESAAARTVRLAIITDSHVISAPSEENYEACESAGRGEIRMTSETEAIFGQALKDSLAESPDGLILCGDLTGNGEKAYAEKVASMLTAIKDKLPGRILVTNGNHDINNSYAAKFEGGKAESTERMSAAEFREIFKSFGFGGNSRFFDGEPSDEIGCSGSLSYAAEICDGITVIVLDTNTYSDDKEKMFSDAQQTAGAVSDELLEWAEWEAKAASKKGNLVLGVCHHAVIPRFSVTEGYAESYQKEYVVPNWEKVAGTLADAGVAAFLTGHSHANDISSYTSEKGNKIYDISTASLISYPVSRRCLEIGITEDEDKTTYSLSTDIHFIRTAEGLELKIGDKTYDDLQSYSYDKSGMHPSSMKDVADYFLTSILFSAQTFKDDVYGEGLQGYLRKLIYSEEGTVGQYAYEAVNKALTKNLPLETELDIGGAAIMLGLTGPINISVTNLDMSSDEYTADLMLTYKVSEGEGEITESAKINLNISHLAAAVDGVIEKLQAELDKTEAGVYTESALREELSKFAASVLRRLLGSELEANVTVEDLLIDAYHQYGMGNEAVEVAEVTKQKFGDLTAEEMSRKRQGWRELFAGEEFAGKTTDMAVEEIAGLTNHTQYPILSSILDTPLNLGKSIISFTDISVTTKENDQVIEVPEQVSFIRMLSLLMSVKTPTDLINLAGQLQTLVGVIPPSIIQKITVKASGLLEAMVTDTNEPQDHSLAFDCTVDKPREKADDGKGDVNGDGRVNLKDLVLLRRYLNKWPVDINIEAADMNGDNKINMKDYIALQRRLNKWPV